MIKLSIESNQVVRYAGKKLRQKLASKHTASQKVMANTTPDSVETFRGKDSCSTYKLDTKSEALLREAQSALQSRYERTNPDSQSENASKCRSLIPFLTTEARRLLS